MPYQMPFRKKRPVPNYKNEILSDEEARVLEEEFIKQYTGDSKSTYKILFSMYKLYPLQLFLSLFFYLLALLPHIFLPIVTANIINLAVYPAENSVKKLIINVLFIAFLTIMNVPMNVLRIRYQSIVMRRVETGLRSALVKKLQQLSIPFHKVMQSGRIQSKLMRDVETVYNLSHHLFNSVPTVVINLVSALIIVISKNLTIFSFFLLSVPASVVLSRKFRKPLRENNRMYRKDMEKTSADIMEMIEMTEITRAHGLENMEIRKITSILNKTATTGFHLDMIQAMFSASSWVVFQLFQLLCLAFSSWMAFKGEIQIGDISLYQSYFSTLVAQVSSILGLMPIITKGFESISSLGEILSSDDIEDNTGKRVLESLTGNYEFSNIEFSYEDDQPLLKGLNLKVKAGETIAIVGESGSGKTTLMNLILGFNFPTNGKLLVDGQDITTINLHEYRQHLAVVPQHSVLFTGSIRENITYGMDNVSEDELNKILDAALLSDFVSKLPMGVDTMLNEHGSNLSGGQKQRISIARALIRNPDVIIFDEATSALDTLSEKEIQQAINNLSKDKTTFIVAHRLSTIKNADRIAVMKDGVCCEMGTYDELVQKKGEFYRMQQPQTV